MAKPALILLDLQNDFLQPNGALPVFDGPSVIPVLNSVKEHASKHGFLVVHTQDWHPRNHISFASRHPDQKLFSLIDLPGKWQQLVVPDHCVADTWGSQIHPAVLPSPTAHIIRKGMDPEVESHTAFYDIKGGSTGLRELLLERSVDTLYLCGIHIDVLLLKTVQDALKLYPKPSAVQVITDATRGFVPARFEESWKQMRDAGATFLTTAEFLERIK